jgi:hypothetical protein
MTHRSFVTVVQRERVAFYNTQSRAGTVWEAELTRIRDVDNSTEREGKDTEKMIKVQGQQT